MEGQSSQRRRQKASGRRLKDGPFKTARNQGTLLEGAKGEKLQSKWRKGRKVPPKERTRQAGAKPGVHTGRAL